MTQVDVVVIGGGPVGLLLGCRLAELGLSFVVLERSVGPRQTSRAIGLLPPGLAVLRASALLGAVLERGVRIERAQAWGSRGRLGEVDLTARPGPIRYAVALPQSETERLLEDRLERLRPAALRRGRRAVGLTEDNSGVRVQARTSDGRTESFRGAWVVGCDGCHSFTRKWMAIGTEGRARPEEYAMLDVADDTTFGNDAVVFLADEGLVESFPLPGRKRRWVAEIPAGVAKGARVEMSADDVAGWIEARTGHRLRSETVTMTSRFGVAQCLARRLVAGRVVLVGDAAHVVSPFGAQGMNLGWVGAARLAAALLIACSSAADAASRVLLAYDRRQRKAARRAMRRAAMNRLVGRRTRRPELRNRFVEAALLGVPDRLLARVFTMAPVLGSDDLIVSAAPPMRTGCADGQPVLPVV